MKRLEHEAHPAPPEQSAPVVIEGAQVDAVDEHGAGVGSVEPRDQVEKRRLAGAGFAHDRDVLARGHLQRDVLQNGAVRVAAEPPGQISDLDGHTATAFAARGRTAYAARGRMASSRLPRRRRCSISSY